MSEENNGSGSQELLIKIKKIHITFPNFKQLLNLLKDDKSICLFFFPPPFVIRNSGKRLLSLGGRVGDVLLKTGRALDCTASLRSQLIIQSNFRALSRTTYG